MQTGSPDINLQTASSKWTPIIVWVVLALLYAEPVMRGRWDIVASYAPGIALISWLLFVFFWAPGITIGQHAATVRNVWRSTVLPYPVINDVVVAAMVRLMYTDADGTEKKLTSWGAPGLPKLPKAFARPIVGSAPPQHSGRKNEPLSAPPDLIGESQLLVTRWRERQDVAATGPVTRSWHLVTIVTTVVLVAWAVWGLLT